MVNVFLIISAVVLAIIGLVTVTIAMVKFSHPDDKNGAYFPRVVVVLGMFWAICSVLILPFDVANQRGQSGGLEIGLLWQLIFFVIAIWLVIVIPFAFNYYESDVDSDELRESGEGCCATQTCQAIKFTLITFVVFALIFGISYPFLRFASIPVERQTVFLGSIVPVGGEVEPPTTNECPEKFSSSYKWPFDPDMDLSGMAPCKELAWNWELAVTFPIYIMAGLSFLGWFLFVVFAGVGLVALPMDLITDFLGRPKRLDFQEYSRQKLKIGERAKLLREAGESLKEREIEHIGTKMTRKEKREHSRIVNKYEKAVYLLKGDYIYIKKAFVLKGGNPLWYWMELFIGVIGLGISLSWVIHICIFLLPAEPVHPFLNNLFIQLGFDGFELFGVCAFTCYAMWLLWACIKGNFKIGLRIPLLLRIYPMELENTLMNAFLVNTWVILLCSFPCVQFCAISFPIYARGTSIDLIFGTQVRYMRFFNYFFDNNVFIYALAIIAILSIPGLLFFRKDKGAEIEAELERDAAALERQGRDLES